MFSHDGAGWFVRCGGCLASLPPEVASRIRHGTRDDVVRELLELAWEIGDGDRCWCLECSRRRRHVPFPTTSRGHRGRRR